MKKKHLVPICILLPVEIVDAYDERAHNMRSKRSTLIRQDLLAAEQARTANETSTPTPT